MRENAYAIPPQGMGTDDWAHIQSGLLQRMALLEAVALDVHGPQTLLQQGRIPAALAVGHGGHVPVLRGIQPKARRWLSGATFKVARHAAGGWQVLSCTPQLQPSQVSNARFRSLLTDWLTHWTPVHPGGDVDALWVVVDPWGTTAPGPMDQPPSSPLWLPPTSLQVHGQQLLAMTEQGPRPVHGLIHLASEGAVDPLEQNADVSLGIAGLMNAFRNGQVMMFNAPGLGFLQSPAWMGFMTPLSQQCLGQELILPSLPTWWCGESDVLESAMDLWADGWMLPTYPDDGLRPAQPMIDGGALTASQRAAWGSTLLSQGANHTIQARPPRGTHWDVLVLMHPDGSATSVCTGTHDPELAP